MTTKKITYNGAYKMTPEMNINEMNIKLLEENQPPPPEASTQQNNTYINQEITELQQKLKMVKE
eukprot:8038465-Ditylum_brightwellii.AAC.1